MLPALPPIPLPGGCVPSGRKLIKKTGDWAWITRSKKTTGPAFQRARWWRERRVCERGGVVGRAGVYCLPTYPSTTEIRLGVSKTQKPWKKASMGLKTRFKLLLPFGSGWRKSPKNGFKGPGLRLAQPPWLVEGLPFSLPSMVIPREIPNPRMTRPEAPRIWLADGLKEAVGQSRGLRVST